MAIPPSLILTRRSRAGQEAVGSTTILVVLEDRAEAVGPLALLVRLELVIRDMPVVIQPATMVVEAADQAEWAALQLQLALELPAVSQDLLTPSPVVEPAIMEATLATVTRVMVDRAATQVVGLEELADRAWLYCPMTVRTRPTCLPKELVGPSPQAG